MSVRSLCVKKFVSTIPEIFFKILTSVFALAICRNVLLLCVMMQSLHKWYLGKLNNSSLILKHFVQFLDVENKGTIYE